MADTKRFRIYSREETAYKVAAVMLLATVALIFTDPNTGFAVHAGAKDGLRQAALEDAAARAFAEKHPDYAMQVLLIDADELAYLEKKYPAIYSSLPAPLYELRLESGTHGLLVLMSDATVYRTFAYEPDG
ncbi:MAG: hypothetical protein HYY37_03875 [Candidatus Aenigmarchaeota archaeon]|nr:hypothetical protein [Candidatus Aenigmarchaeota archaeon]